MWVFLPGWLHSELFPPKAHFLKKKKCLWYKNTIIALVGKIFLPFPLSVSTSSHPICHYCPGSGLESIFGNNVCSRYILRTLCVFLPGQYMHNEDCPGALHTILIRFFFFLLIVTILIRFTFSSSSSHSPQQEQHCYRIYPAFWGVNPKYQVYPKYTRYPEIPDMSESK